MKLISLKATLLALSLGSPLFASQTLLNEWTVEMGRTESRLEYYQRVQVAGPTVVGNSFVIAAPNGELQKRSLQTGEVIWATALEGVSPSAWAVDGGQVFGGDSKGFIYSIDFNDGKIIWKVPSKAVYYSKPLVLEHQVFVMNSAGILQSFDRASGQWIWQQGESEAKQISLWSFQGPVLFHSQVVAGFPEGQLFAFEPKSGNQIWKESFNLNGVGDSFNDLKSVSADSQYLFASSFGGDLKAWQISGASKKLLWSKKLSLHAPLAVISEDEIAFSTRDGNIWLLEGKTGYQKWQYPLGEGLGTQPVLANGKIWLGTSAGSLVVLSEEGKLITEDAHFRSAIWNPPTMLNDNEALIVTAKGLIRRVKLVKVD